MACTVSILALRVATRLPLYPPVSLKLGRTRRKAPSYGGCEAYLIGLSPLYLGFGAMLSWRSPVAQAKTGSGSHPCEALAAGIDVSCLPYRAMLAGSTN